METAFVAGATGYTGSHLVELLRRQGIRTVAHVRPDSRRLEGWRERFGALGAETDTTPWDEEALSRRLAELSPTWVFCLIGTTRARGREAPADTYETVDYGLTALLARATARSGARPRFVYLSSLGAGPSAKGAYLQARWRAEKTVQESGIPYTIVRPSFISGADREESRPLERLGATVSDRVLELAGALGATGLRNRFHSIDAAGLSAVLLRLAREPDAEGLILEPPYD